VGISVTDFVVKFVHPNAPFVRASNYLRTQTEKQGLVRLVVSKVFDLLISEISTFMKFHKNELEIIKGN
jgi:hypothetical protein